MTSPSDEQVLATADAFVDALQDRNRILQRVVFGLLVVILLLGGGEWQLHNSQVHSCRSNNEMRQGLLNFAGTIEQNNRDQAATRTPEQINASNAYVAELRHDFALRDC